MEKNTGIIIVGVNRGGTSAIAASLNSLNISLGEHCHEPTFEDVQLARHFRKRDWKKFKSQIKTYESKQQLFAWKLPDSVNRLKKVNRSFQNPKYIFVFRDIYAISYRQNHSLGIPLLKGMFFSLLKYLKILHFIRSTRPDCLLVSYEKILTDKDKFASDLLSFLEFETSQKNIDCIKDTISSSDYREWAEKTKNARVLKDNGYNGHLDHFDENKVMGWVMNSRNDHPITVEVFINQEKIGEVLADQYRGDLVDSSLSEKGYHGFTFSFHNTLAQDDEIAIKPKSINADLIGSPKRLNSAD